MQAIVGRSRFRGVGRVWVALLAVATALPALAHEVVVRYETRSGVEVTAQFGGGVPLAGAIVEVYPPGSETPATTGVCDDRGRFLFFPTQPVDEGTWRLKVRHSGHAQVIEVPLGDTDTDAPASGTTRLGTLQYVVMTACVVWGLIGTALFFARRRG